MQGRLHTWGARPGAVPLLCIPSTPCKPVLTLNPAGQLSRRAARRRQQQLWRLVRRQLPGGAKPWPRGCVKGTRLLPGHSCRGGCLSLGWPSCRGHQPGWQPHLSWQVARSSAPRPPCCSAQAVPWAVARADPLPSFHPTLVCPAPRARTTGAAATMKAPTTAGPMPAATVAAPITAGRTMAGHTTVEGRTLKAPLAEGALSRRARRPPSTPSRRSRPRPPAAPARRQTAQRAGRRPGSARSSSACCLASTAPDCLGQATEHTGSHTDVLASAGRCSRVCVRSCCLRVACMYGP